MDADLISRNAVDAIISNLSSFAREQNKDELLRQLRLYLHNRVQPVSNKITQLVYTMV
jgi:hypothetical protein